ncbi:ComF family protein [Polaribacter sp. HL-MS24]|uniref:ComF family protein n=1 Tax=Polaribacter sp. HL-MS24 TaxID=3077735 RepID=UPI0029348A9D|nr:phosphoribosyltransferase family protein [Polaribacter sp. HL-MS24]WOC39505.1 phosphoribosyltransferase family protein [Polaribacter sp. HL-MS24]
MQFLKNLINLFYPNTCAICELPLLQNEAIACTLCRHDLPVIYSKDACNNPIVEKFYGRISIEEANTLLRFTKEGKTKKLIHELKYRGNEQIGEFLGDWLGVLILENKHFSEIDCIVPVPLHSKRLKERGYNQLTKFGKRLSFHLQIPLKENFLVKISANKTQTFKNRYERFKNVDTRFSITHTKVFENQHILLIDDVITTGATLEACCKELLKTQKIKISILTLSCSAQV